MTGAIVGLCIAGLVLAHVVVGLVLGAIMSREDRDE